MKKSRVLEARYLFQLLFVLIFVREARGFTAGVPSDPEFGTPSGLSGTTSDITLAVSLDVVCADTPTLSGGDGADFERIGALVREEVLAPTPGSRDVPLPSPVKAGVFSVEVNLVAPPLGTVRGGGSWLGWVFFIFRG
jgi:hypothetical protein